MGHDKRAHQALYLGGTSCEAVSLLDPYHTQTPFSCLEEESGRSLQRWQGGSLPPPHHQSSGHKTFDQDELICI